MTVKESFKRFFIEFAQENFAQVTSENALTIYTAGDKNGRKNLARELYNKMDLIPRKDGLDWQNLLEILEFEIDTELKKIESNEN